MPSWSNKIFEANIFVIRKAIATEIHKKMPSWSNKIFKANIFVIHKAIPKFTKILSHGNLEPYGIFSMCVV